MSRGTAFNDPYEGIQPVSPWPDPGEEFHENGDEERLEKYSKIIEQAKPTHKTTITFSPTVALVIDKKMSLWTRFWFWFLFDFKTEVEKCN